MKTKYPGTLWVAMSRDEYRPAFGVYERKPDFKMASGEIALRYHLHPSNEVGLQRQVRNMGKRLIALTVENLRLKRHSPGRSVARALNVLHQAGLEMIARPYFLIALQDAGFRVRWDAKKGRFR